MGPRPAAILVPLLVPGADPERRVRADVREGDVIVPEDLTGPVVVTALPLEHDGQRFANKACCTKRA